MAARMALSVLVGHSSGQRIGMSSYSAARRSTSAMPASRSSVTAPGLPAGLLPDAAEQDRLPDRHDREHLVERSAVRYAYGDPRS